MADVKWTNEQLQAINEKGSPILVAAAAGSGKTAVLVERIIHKVIHENMNIDKMLVVTFTNAAASEMRERVLKAIYTKLEETPENVHLQKQITLLSKASICTIHSFCLEVIRNYFYEINISNNFRIADTTEVDLLKQEALEEVQEECYEKQENGFLELLEMYTGYRSDESLKQLLLTIYEFIQSSPFPEKWTNDKIEILKCNITEDFATTKWGELILQEVKEQVEDAKLKLEKMENKLNYFEELQAYQKVLQNDKMQLVFLQEHLNSWDKTYQLISQINWEKWPVNKKITNDLKDDAKQVRDDVKKQINKIIEKWMIGSSNQVTQDIRKMSATMQYMQTLLKKFTQVFETKKREKNCIDFHDIEHLALKILVKEDGSPSEVAKQYSEKLEEIAIDEYQDSNLVQEFILNSVSRGNNIFMVGDVKQSIYRFRQARPELFLEKYEKYTLKQENEVAKEGLKIQLFRNFRSRQNILDITNLLFENIMSKELGDIAYNENEYLNYGAGYEEPIDNTITYAGKAEIHIIDLKEKEEITAFNDDAEEIEQLEERIEDEVLEAKFVAKKIQELIQSKYQVYDKKIGYRPITYKDIVILLRSTSSLAPVFEGELAKANLPVFSDVSSSYLDTVEIQTILAVLKIIDNPLQEIPLVTVLRSMLAGFTDNDLIQIRLTDKNCNFYEALLKARLKAEGNLKIKIENFIMQLEEWVIQADYLPLEELIWKIYKDTGYYHYVGLLPNGAIRQANLKILFEKAKQYASTNFKGLFYFIHFMNQLKKQNGDLASAKLIGENENVVRIMSIHKSKGLEFPVVFLCAMQKKFNMQDLNESILIHQDLGFGPNVIDIQKRIQYPSLAKEAIKIKAKQETISEEERILYVALTRAKEKLIMTARSKDFQKEWSKKQQEIELYGNEKVNIHLLKKANSYLNWLEYVYLANENKTILLKGKPYKIADIMSFYTYSKEEIMKKIGTTQETIEKSVYEIVQEEINKLGNENQTIKGLEKLFSWKYANEIETHLLGKTAVTKIKQNNLEETEIKHEMTVESPKFLRGEEKVSAARKGSIIHLCIQKLDEQQEYTLEKIKAFILNLVEKEIITQKEAESINTTMLYQYTQSELFRELKNAKEIHKEQPFYRNFLASQIYLEAKDSNATILVQGIIDLYYINQNNELILIDFKTDYVTKGKEQEIKNKYKTQLEIYKKTLEEALNRKVDKAEIYFLGTGPT